MEEAGKIKRVTKPVVQNTPSPKGTLSIIDNRPANFTTKNTLQKQGRTLAGNRIAQKVSEDNYSGKELIKYKLVKKIISQKARIDYIGINQLLKNVPQKNMDVILTWSQDYLKGLPWNMYLLEILNNPFNLGKYTLESASYALGIDERKYATGSAIRFTKFTSCVGIIGKVDDDNLIGIHLSVFGPNDTFFTEDDVAKVKKVLGSATNVVIIGLLDFWDQGILNKLEAETNGRSVNKGSGKYGARINNGTISFYDNGIYKTNI